MIVPRRKTVSGGNVKPSPSIASPRTSPQPPTPQSPATARGLGLATPDRDMGLRQHHSPISQHGISGIGAAVVTSGTIGSGSGSGSASHATDSRVRYDSDDSSDESDDERAAVNKSNAPAAPPAILPLDPSSTPEV